MKVRDVLTILLEDGKIDPKEIYINGMSYWNIDTTDSEFINLLEVPVYHYFNNGDGTITIDTMWS